MENIDYVNQGFRILLPQMAGSIARELNKAYKNAWWDEVLDTLSDQLQDLPQYGNYGDLVDSLDVANCIRLIDRKWNDIFRYCFSSKSYRTYAIELMGVRNAVAHNGQQDLDQPMAERALDTMALFCHEIDPEAENEIRDLYKEVRKRSIGDMQAYSGPAQPVTDILTGSVSKDSLLKRVGTDGVEKTQLTRKITINGETLVYPVYRIRLNLLYYNDQNDRISTWINRYETENGSDSLKSLDRDIYNRIIEGFIFESNPDAIIKTQNNIAAVGQRLPGVILDDGRVIDGNRRFTCLRRIQRTTGEPAYFETAILQADIAADKKQIKLLELAIQHGEEEKVDYDQIDYATGTYRDIVQTHLLSVNEYAVTTNETESEVRKRIQIAQLMNDFLSFIRLPGQYFAVRDYQIYDLLVSLADLVKKEIPERQKKIKNIVFANVMMHSISDSRKFARDLRKLLKSSEAEFYIDEQSNLIQEIREKYDQEVIRAKEDVDHFADQNKTIAREMQDSMQNCLLTMRNEIIKIKPEENAGKAMDLLTNIDQRMFSRMTPNERIRLKDEIEQVQSMSLLLLKKLNELE